MLKTDVWVVSSCVPGMGKTRAVLERIDRKQQGSFNNRIICHPRDSIRSFVDGLVAELSGKRLSANYHFDFTGVLTAPEGAVCSFSRLPKG